MSRSSTILIPLQAAFLLTFSSMSIFTVSAQSVGSTVTISLSGNETISHSTSVDVGDTFSIGYTIKSSNETSYVTTTVGFELEAGFSQTIFTNRTMIDPHQTRMNGTMFTASEKGAIVVTYDGCSNPCKGRVSINSNYSVQTDLLQSYMRTTLMWSPFLAIALTGGLVGGYFLGRNRLTNLMKKGKWNPPTSGGESSRFGIGKRTDD